jgi:tetratricopeptide (TPR) repeat protein
MVELEARDQVWAARATAERNTVIKNGKQRPQTSEERLAPYAKLLETRPDDPNVHEGLARQYLRRYRSDPDNLENLAKLEEHFGVALALNPPQSELSFSFGRALLLNKNYAKAEEVTRKYLATNPVAPLAARAMRLLSEISTQQGKPEEAARLRHEADALHPVASLPDIPEHELFSPPE